ncbi:MAG: hypothetical protein R2939_12420 [Kofleriaceae bacterium]
MPGRALIITPLLLATIACAKDAEPRPSTPPANAAAKAPAAGETIPVPGARLATRSPGTPVFAGDDGATPAKAGADTSFAVAVTAPPPGKAGARQVAKVRATPGPGYHMNHEYPAALRVDAVDGVTATKPQLGRGDVASLTDAELVFEVELTADRAGTFSVPAEFKFAVCTDSSCDPKKQTVTIALTAQ